MKMPKNTESKGPNLAFVPRRSESFRTCEAIEARETEAKRLRGLPAQKVMFPITDPKDPEMRKLFLPYAWGEMRSADCRRTKAKAKKSSSEDGQGKTKSET
jgi:hypothetical protein